MNIRNLALIALAAALVAGNACSNEKGAKDETTAQAQAQTAPQAAPEAAPQPAAGTTLAGTVMETMDAGPYTYVRVEAGGREIWAAANKFQVTVGEQVVVPLDMPMESFHSDTLNRDFPLIYFAGAIAKEGEAKAPVMPAGHPPIAGADAAHGTAPVAPVEPVAGGLTIAEVWAGRSRLADSTVTVRGRVVKFNPGIMGTNWLHLQDGSGSSANGTHDLTVTTPGAATVGDVVTATGAVAVDQDFGAGYSYPVLLREAAIVTQSPL
jgi:hypothetical protein